MPSEGTAEGDDPEVVRSGNILGIRLGGHSILYDAKDPYVRHYYEWRLRQDGVEPTFPAAR